MAQNAKSMSVRDRRPLYVQAIEALTNMIETGQLKTGSQLPPEDEFAAKLGISRSTLREALGHLETHGLIARRQGIGTFVTIPSSPGFFGGLQRLEPFKELARTAGVQHSDVETSIDAVTASPKLAAVLDTEVGVELVYIQTIQAIDEIRCMYVNDYLIDMGGLFEKLSNYKKSVLTYMFDECNPSLSFTRSEIFAIEATDKIASKLKVPKGKPVFHMEETYFAARGNILGVGFSYFITDNFRFYITRKAILGSS